ncbi:Glycoprotein [Frankliniella fusca]|uniref:Glycoprotein n=1 Tax=Frankliniella fusca TaxID=407009 RepID=A0AAE1HK84_9NEOP|nr:Glycoprotein [Frankliniella fusca]
MHTSLAPKTYSLAVTGHIFQSISSKYVKLGSYAIATVKLISCTLNLRATWAPETPRPGQPRWRPERQASEQKYQS